MRCCKPQPGSVGAHGSSNSPPASAAFRHHDCPVMASLARFLNMEEFADPNIAQRCVHPLQPLMAFPHPARDFNPVAWIMHLSSIARAQCRIMRYSHIPSKSGLAIVSPTLPILQILKLGDMNLRCSTPSIGYAKGFRP